MPELAIHKHTGMAASFFEVVAEIEVVIFPVRNDDLIKDVIAAHFAVDPESVERKQRSGLELFYFLKLIINLGVGKLALVFQNVTKGNLTGSVYLNISQNRINHISVENQLLLLIGDGEVLLGCCRLS